MSILITLGSKVDFERYSSNDFFGFWSNGKEFNKQNKLLFQEQKKSFIFFLTINLLKTPQNPYFHLFLSLKYNNNSTIWNDRCRDLRVELCKSLRSSRFFSHFRCERERVQSKYLWYLNKPGGYFACLIKNSYRIIKVNQKQICSCRWIWAIYLSPVSKLW